MSKTRIALVFDDRTRPETTGFYCRRALESLAQVEFFHPDCLAEVPDCRLSLRESNATFAERKATIAERKAAIPRTGFDLYLSIDDGFDYAWPAELRPAAYWAIDTHLDFERSLRRAANVDFVFAAQRDGAERLRAAGIASARWLPLACDPQMHRPHDVPKRFDVAYVGHLVGDERCELARLIQRRFRGSFFGQAYFDEMAAVYSAARVAFNRSVRNDINMRVFEALACGPLLMTNDLADNGQNELFRDGVHLATYGDGDELLDKLQYYLCRERAISSIAAAGRAEVLQKHTYGQRMAEILNTVAEAQPKRCPGSSKAEWESRNSEFAPSQSVGNALCGVPPRGEKASGIGGRGSGSSLADEPFNDGTVLGAPRNATEGVPYRPAQAGAPEESGTVDGGSRNATEDVPYRPAQAGAPRESGTVDGGSRNATEGVPNRLDGLGTPSSGAAERHRGISAQNLRARGTNDAAYFEFARPELLALVPQTAGRVLEVGCGAGRLGEALKARQACEVVGVERNRDAAQRARARLDQVYAGNVERMELPFAAERFDCIVCGDVLEHLALPERFLCRAREWLAADGVLVASIPNVRHHSVVNALLAGNWTYEPAGLLDTTHRHFFTRRGLEGLFQKCGYLVTQLGMVPGTGHAEWRDRGCPNELRLGGLAVSGLARDEAEEFFVYQFWWWRRSQMRNAECGVRSRDRSVKSRWSMERFAVVCGTPQRAFPTNRPRPSRQWAMEPFEATHGTARSPFPTDRPRPICRRACC